MTASLREIAQLMNPVSPARSLKDLFRQHRWLDSNNEPVQLNQLPDGTLNLRRIIARHAKEGDNNYKFLAYNVWLLPGVDITYDMSDILAAAGYTAFEALIQFHIDIAEAIYKLQISAADAVADLVGLDDVIEHAGLNKAAVYAALAAIAFGTLGIGALAGPAAILWVIKEYAVDCVKVLGRAGITIVDLIKWANLNPLHVMPLIGINQARLLLHFFDIELPHPLQFAEKPYLEERALCVGRTCEQNNYDIMALEEVFDWPTVDSDQARNLIDKAWKDAGRSITTIKGEGKSTPGSLLDSGLYHIYNDRCRLAEDSRSDLEKLFAGNRHAPIRRLVYSNKGHKMVDTDAWANKGVLLTRVRLGDIGVIDLYNTHLISGAEAYRFFGFLTDGENEEDYVYKVRMRQINELVDFVIETHNENHVAVVCGDTNIKINEIDKFKEMQKVFDRANLYDLWYIQHGIEGGTHGPDDMQAARFNNICSPFDGDPQYCTESSSGSTGERIDVFFVERPTAKHDFTLDFTLIRRLPFNVTGLADEPFISDHLGYETIFVANPK